MQYIALLRGINIGGHTVKMEDLRKVFEELSLSQVRSYIQTGNVFFESTKNEQELQEIIESHLEKKLGYAVPTAIRTVEEIEDMLLKNPFKGIELTKEKRFSVTFLSRPSNIDLPVPFITPDGGYELVGKTDKELFVVWHLKNGKPGNSYGLLEKKVGVPTTTRFWHTMEKMFQVVKKH